MTPMLVVKWLLSGAVVAAASELAKRWGRLGGLVAALPLVTLLSLAWMRLERQDPARIADHARYTFWYVVPTLPTFLVFPRLLPRLDFWGALAASVVGALAFFALFAWICARLGGPRLW